jgi:probable rRNA maturation factor
MALTVSIQGQGRFVDLPARGTLVRWIGAAVERDAELTVRFVGAAEARRLNSEFRGKDYATNVLTFDYQHAPVVLADIVLCVPVVRSEARAQRKAFREHLAHLLVHGVLHAQGHDHDRAARARKMEAEEVRILGGLGIDDPYREGGVAGG